MKFDLTRFSVTLMFTMLAYVLLATAGVQNWQLIVLTFVASLTSHYVYDYYIAKILK